jgi:hypothetical protein
MTMKYLALCCLIIAVLGQNLPKQTPVIGIYTQYDNDDSIQATFTTYISAAYIKYIEMSGAQVVPLFAYGTQSEIAKVL